MRLKPRFLVVLSALLISGYLVMQVVMGENRSSAQLDITSMPTPLPTLELTSVAASPPTFSADMSTEDLPLLHQEVAAPTAAPTPTGVVVPPSEPVQMRIDTIGLDQSLIPVGLDARNIPIVPQHDVGWYIYSAEPGQGENVVLWGHVARFQATPDVPAPFEHLHTASIGDPITVHTADGTAHNYVIAEQVWVNPDQIEYVLPQGREQLTLVSCIGDRVIADGALVDMSHRLITIAVPE
jgi:hypothetical protein